MTSLFILYPRPSPSRPPSIPHDIRFWMIEETTGAAHYIILPGVYTSKRAAKRAFPKGGGNFRAVEYQQGRGHDGPERINP